jgi:tripartite ATP-independent transporter DctM subunit
MNETVGVVGIFVLMLLFLTNIEISFAMAVVGFAGFAMLISVQAATTMVIKDFYQTFTSYGLTVVPLFVLMGQIAFNAGIANRLYETSHRFLGHIPGGLALATVVGVTIFKAICGSAAATTATFAGVAVPEMDRFGYSKKLSTGIVAAAGTLGNLLPPSVTLIIFGMITEQSIGKLFLAGFIPGLLLSFLFLVVIVGWCKVDPSIGPKSEKYTWRQRAVSLPAVIWPMAIFVLMIGGLMGGIFTPTEAGSVGALAVILLTVIKRDINHRGIAKSIIESLRTSCMVLMLIATSTVLGHFFAVSNIPTMTAQWVVKLSVHRHVIMILIMFIYLIGGSFIDDLAFMMLATPIFFPLIIKLGYDPIWAGIMICITVMIGCIVPPVAMNVFVVKNITKVPLGIIYTGTAPFLISLILLAALLFMFPEIVLYLPNALMK